jgi:hypothetical protein
VSQITVTTTNGVVRLSGTVDSLQRIDRAYGNSAQCQGCEIGGKRPCSLGMSNKRKTRTGQVQEKIGEIKKIVGK